MGDFMAKPKPTTAKHHITDIHRKRSTFLAIAYRMSRTNALTHLSEEDYEDLLIHAVNGKENCRFPRRSNSFVEISSGPL